MTALRVLSLPYDSGRRDVGMGRGPTELLERGLPRRLEDVGLEVEVTVIEAPDSGPEIKRTIEADARLADAVRATVADGAFPLVLAGNCNSALGTTAGLGGDELGVLWFDAHADFDTPEDNLSGYFDVFALAMLTGSGWETLRRTIPGFREIAESRVVLAAVRDLHPYQRERLEASAIHAVSGDRIRTDGIDRALRPALDHLAAGAAGVYLHLDVDALDPSEGRANEFAAPGGVTLAELEWAIGAAFASLDVRGAALTAYDPGADPEGRMGETAMRVAEAVARAVA